MSDPKISKAARIVGNQLVFRNAGVQDAPFIHGLRIDKDKSRYLSGVTGGVEGQVSWLRSYGQSDDQAYFIIENLGGDPLGTVRLYDAQGDSFCWGSWILKDGSPPKAAVESTLMVYQYALDALGFRAAHFDVRIGNEGVWSFHERFGATRVRSTELDHFYTIDELAIRTALTRLARFLPKPLGIEPLHETEQVPESELARAPAVA